MVIDRWETSDATLHLLVAPRASNAPLTFPAETTVVLREGNVIIVRCPHETIPSIAASYRIRPLPVSIIEAPPAPALRTPFKCSRDSAAPSDLRIRNLVAAISSVTIMQQVRHLQSYRTRFTSADTCAAAADGLIECLEGYGWHVSSSPWTWGEWSGRNIIADLPGRTPQRPVVLLTAHYDSTNNRGDPLVSAPGADDNASGCAALLEIARILSTHAQRCESGIRLAFFSGEEQGLLGSAVYARSLRERGESLAAVINLDMIGYRGPDAPRDADVTGNTASQWLVSLLQEIAETGPPIAAVDGRVNNTAWWSDHASFWDQGYHAVVLEASADPFGPEFNPYYHSSEDTWDKLDGSFLADNTRTALACMLALAVPVDTVAPAHIADLSSTPGSIPGTAILHWTTPGTDGTSGVLWGSFLICIASTPTALTPTEARFIHPASGIVPGTLLHQVIAADGETYAGIWARDDFGNLSGASPIVSVHPAPGSIQNTPPLSPVDLLVDGSSRAFAVSERPRLSWRAVDLDPWDVPTAFHVIVGSHPTILSPGEGVFWDSGKVRTTAEQTVYGASLPLPAGSTCWWAVRTWDLFDGASPWSSTAAFVVRPSPAMALHIAAPVPGTTFTHGDTVVCHARWQGEPSLVIRVELLVNGTPVAAAYNPPYLLSWVATGDRPVQTLQARAYTPQGSLDSEPISIVIQPAVPSLAVRPGDVRILIPPRGIFRPGSGEHATIVIAPAFTDDVHLTVLTLAGARVWNASLPVIGKVTTAVAWPGITGNGAPVASGIYLVHVRGAGIDRIVKLAAVR